jgi:hypothetical protein
MPGRVSPYVIGAKIDLAGSVANAKVVERAKIEDDQGGKSRLESAVSAISHPFGSSSSELL